MIQLPSITPGYQRFMYKTYSICLSDEKPRHPAELPYRIVSIVDHTGRNEPLEKDLLYILESCGMNMNMPITHSTTEVWGVPTRGNTQ